MCHIPQVILKLWASWIRSSYVPLYVSTFKSDLITLIPYEELYGLFQKQINVSVCVCIYECMTASTEKYASLYGFINRLTFLLEFHVMI